MATVKLDPAKGVQIPNKTTTERNAISSPETGALIWNTTTSAVNQYNGSAWGTVGISEDTTKLPLAGGALTGAVTTNSTFDGVDIATRDAVLTSTTTTAGAALPKAGGTLTGDVSLVKASGNSQILVEASGTDAYATVRVKNDAKDYSMQIRSDQGDAWTVRDETAGANRIKVDGSTGDTILGSDLIFETAGKGICLGVTTNTDANTLDDFEEGTWTPTLNNTGGSPSYTWQKGHYVKVGAWVWLTANVKFTVTPSGATQQAVGGLPFANRSGAGQYTAAMFTPKQGFAYDGDGLTADIYDGSTIAYLEEYIAGTGGNGGSLLANEIGTTVEFRFSTFYTTS